MPELPSLQPGAPTGPGRERQPEDVPPPPPDQESFKSHLEAKLAARRTKRAVPQERADELLRLFNRRGEAFKSVRLVTKYPPIEKDDALYEVRTDKGARRVMRSRNGSYTVFD